MSEAKRDQLVAGYASVFDGLLDATEGLEATGWSTPTGCPGWDVHDQLAHCIGVERYLLGDPMPDVEVRDLPHIRDDIGRFTERDVEARRGVPGDELRTEARETFDRRRDELRSLDPAMLEHELPGPPALGRVRGSQLLRIRIFDLATHEQDIRRALQRLDGFAGPHLPIGVELVLRAWSKLLPARVERDGLLEVAIDGHTAVVLDLADGTLHRDPERAPAPAATLRCDAAALLALGGGRRDAPPLDGLDVDGDRDLVGMIREVAGVTP